MANTKKHELRKQYLEKRKGLTPAARTRDSAIIRQRILRHTGWQDAGTILVYVSGGSEVDTRKLIEEGLAQRKRIVVPLIDPDGHDTSLSELRAIRDLVPAHYSSVHEPVAAFRKIVDPSEIELALLPGVVFDRKGGRVGLGGGYFDRLIPK